MFSIALHCLRSVEPHATLLGSPIGGITGVDSTMKTKRESLEMMGGGQVSTLIQIVTQLIPWAYKLYLAVDHSEPSEMAKAHGILSNNSDSAATGSKEEEQGCPRLEDTALPPSLSLAERRAIYQMVHSVLACE